MNNVYEITTNFVLFVIFIISVSCVAFPLQYLQICLKLPVFISGRLQIKLGEESQKELEELYKSPEIFVKRHCRYLKMIQLSGWGGILVCVGLMSLKFI